MTRRRTLSCLAVLVCALALPLRASADSPVVLAPQTDEVNGLRTRGERLRIAGIVLSLAGIGLGIGGGLVIKDCCTMPATVPTSMAEAQPLVDDLRNRLILGGVLAGVGFGTLVTGITLFAVGQSNINTANRMSRGLSLAPGPRNSLGGSLRLDF